MIDFALLLGLVSIPVAITVLLDLLKYVKVVKDGTADVWSKALNILVFVVLYVAKAVGIDLGPVDDFAAQFADFGASLLAFIPIAIAFSQWCYEKIRGIPLIGKSHSL